MTVRFRWFLILILAAAIFGALVFTRQPAWYVKAAHPIKYTSIIKGHAKNYDIPPELLAAVIQQESDFQPAIRSQAGAVGLMQLQPKTAKGIATRTGGSKFRESDLVNPELNVRYGSWYLSHLHEKLDGSELSWSLALAAYNAGQGNVAKWMADDKDGELRTEEIPFTETRNYVQDVERMADIYRRAYPELAG